MCLPINSLPQIQPARKHLRQVSKKPILAHTGLKRTAQLRHSKNAYNRLRSVTGIIIGSAFTLVVVPPIYDLLPRTAWGFGPETWVDFETAETWYEGTTTA